MTPNDDTLKLEYPKFEDIPVSTKTFIVMTNITIDIDRLFAFLPITEYVIIPKKRGRKKKVAVEDPNKDIPDGSIITIELANKVRGTLTKKKRRKDNTPKNYFRNSVTIVMIMGGKKINFKVSRNGKFQMTGCKQDEHAENCVKQIWEYIKDTDIYVKGDEPFYAIFEPAMRNIDFSLGFTLDREKLDEFFNRHTDYFSLLETSIGYTGVNIKLRTTRDILSLKLKEIVHDGKWKKPIYVPYKKYLDNLAPKDRQKKLEKERYSSFLIFSSGRAIHSMQCAETGRNEYYTFINIIKENYKHFVDSLA